MIISPTVAPAAILDQSSVNQSQINQSNHSEQSRKATDTVLISAQAQSLAATENKPSPQQQAENHAVKQATEAVEKTQKQPLNPATQQAENNFIDVLV